MGEGELVRRNLYPLAQEAVDVRKCGTNSFSSLFCVLIWRIRELKYMIYNHLSALIFYHSRNPNQFLKKNKIVTG